MQKNNQNQRNSPLKTHFKKRLSRVVYLILAGIIATAVNFYNNNLDKTASNDQSTSQLSSEFSKEEQQQAISKIKSAADNTNAQFWVGLKMI